MLHKEVTEKTIGAAMNSSVRKCKGGTGHELSEAYNMEKGLLIDFGAKSLEFKRVYNNNMRQ